ncbi:MAG: ABC transporter permease [Chloroflexi bacterium]|nr:ABC transporter permease [Chloroflexota bacterium]
MTGNGNSWTYDSSETSGRMRQELHEIVRYRRLLSLMITNQFRTRYRRSVLGTAWIFLSPLINTLVFSFAFGQLFRSDIPNYPVYVMIGLLVWTLFVQATEQSIGSAISSSQLSRRIYIPCGLTILSVVGASVINFLLGLLPLFLVMSLAGYQPAISWLLLPLPILILAAFSLGVSLLVSTLAVLVGDVAPIYSALVQVVFFITPVVYPRQIVPDQFAWVFRVNPMVPIVDLFRAVLHENRVPDPVHLLIAIALASTTLVVGWWFHTRKADEFPYYI